MHCSHCGKELNDNSLFCPSCGYKQDITLNHCPNCGEDIQSGDFACSYCGYQLPRVQSIPKQAKSRTFAVFLGIFLGGLGVHNFYLGYSSKGFIQICLFFGGAFNFGITTLASFIWAFVEVVQLLIGSIDRDGDDILLK